MYQETKKIIPFILSVFICSSNIAFADDCRPSSARVSFRENRTVPVVGKVALRISYTATLPANCDARASGAWLGQFQLFSETARVSRFNISRQDYASAYQSFRDRVYLGENNVNILRDGNFYSENDTRYSDVHVLKDGKYTLVAPITYYVENARYEKTFSYKFTVGEVAKPTPKPTPNKPNPTPNPTPINTDAAAPTIQITGLPTTEAEKSNVKGKLNIAINISDDKALQSVSVIGFNTTFIKQSNLNKSSYTNSFILDTALYPDGQYTFTVTATDTSRKVKTYNEILRLTNHGSAPQPVTPTPAPSIPTPTPSNPDNSGDNGTDIGALMNLLVQLLSQLMQVISNLDLNTERSVATTRSLEMADPAEMGIVFAELIKTNKQQLRQIKQTRRIPKIAKRFTKSYKKALKAKSEKRKAKFARKADRQLSRILKNLQ